MAILRILGFDSHPTTMANAWIPTWRAGLAPFIDMYAAQAVHTAGVEASTDGVGVSSRPSDAMASGNKSVICYRSNQGRQAYLHLPFANESVTGQIPYRYCLGFRFKAQPAAITGATAWPVVTGGRMRMASIGISGSTVLASLEVSNTGVLFINGAATSFTIVMDREYYFELRLDNEVARTGNYTAAMELHINGSRAAVFSCPTLAATAVVTPLVRLGLNPTVADASGTPNNQRWAFSDIYVNNLVGEAPYNDVLGPQVVVNMPIEEVVSNSWDVPPDSTVLETITGAGMADDTKFLNSNVDSALQVRLGTPGMDSSKQINGMLVFGRISKTSSSTHVVESALKNGVGDTIVGPAQQAPLAGTFRTFEMASRFPSTLSEALAIRRSVLDSAVYQISAKA